MGKKTDERIIKDLEVATQEQPANRLDDFGKVSIPKEAYESLSKVVNSKNETVDESPGWDCFFLYTGDLAYRPASCKIMNEKCQDICGVVKEIYCPYAGTPEIKNCPSYMNGQTNEEEQDE